MFPHCCSSAPLGRGFIRYIRPMNGDWCKARAVARWPSPRPLRLGQCTSFMRTDFSSSTRPIGGGAKEQEESMFKMTKGDLAQKSDAQLAALFQQATLGLSAVKSDLATAQSLLAMIAAERANRRPSP